MGPGHQHAPRTGEAHLPRLLIVFGLVLGVMVVEAVAGVVSGSLALISDAGHMATDAIGIGMAAAAIHAASRMRRRDHRTYGVYRLEILAALANAVLLFGVAGYVLYEAVRRIAEPAEILSGPMIVVAVIGLIVNIIGFMLLRGGAADSLNVRGAFLEVVADLVGSIGVIIAGLLVWGPGWTWADPVIAAAIGLFILPRAWSLGREAVRVLIEAAPGHIDVDAVRTRLAAIAGVVDVHDLHVWTLTSEMDVATAHLTVGETVDPHPVLDEARRILADDHSITHATLQVEPANHEGCAEVDW